MDEIRDQMDLAGQISEAISQPAGFGAEIDEEELLQELEDLEQLEMDERLVGNTVNTVDMPSVPNIVPGMCY